MTVYPFQEGPPSLAYVDPSFFINLLVKDSKYHQECKEFSKKLKEEETVLILSNLGLDEIWYVILKLEAEKEYGDDAINKLRDPKIVKEYAAEVKDYTERLTNIPRLFFIEITTEQTFQARDLIARYGLLPRDAIHLAATMSGIDNLITTDKDFNRIKKIDVFTCRSNHVDD